MAHEEIAAKLRQAADSVDAGDLKMAGRLAASCVDAIDALRYPTALCVTVSDRGNTVVPSHGHGVPGLATMVSPDEMRYASLNRDPLRQAPFKGNGKSVVRPSSLIGSSSGCEVLMNGKKIS